MIKITFPDGSVREYEAGVTGLEIAQSISQRLAQDVLACGVDGETVELNRPIHQDASVVLYKWEDAEGKHAFWHTSAHLMAEALQELYPGIQFGIGPAIENGFYYDVMPAEGVTIREADFVEIEKKMKELVQRKENLVRQDISKADALKFFGDRGQTYKNELIEDLEDGHITTYTQGAFTDLCRGPHMLNTAPIKACKVLSVSSAYWRGDEKRPQMTRLYAITFPKQKMLDEYLQMLEEAKKRDHRKIGKEMGLFMFSERVGKGLPMWLPKGTALRLRLEDFLKKIQKRYGYQQVITPHIGGKNLYVTSGHYAHYGKDSFQPIHTPEEGEEYMLKPMNCPHHCEIFAWRPRSYKDLPLRLAEFGTVYRYEQSGELHGLTRVRSFTQDDAHVYCRPDQVKDEFIRVMEIIQIIFGALDFDNFEAQISLRDPNDKEKYIGSDEVWEAAEKAIIEACAEKGLKTTTAPFGSMERFVAVLIEHTAGRFPLWFSPEQVVILPVSEKYNEYAYKLQQYFDSQEVRAEVDDRNEKIGRKIRDNEVKHIPYLLIVGEKEQSEGTVSFRRQGGGEQGTLKFEDFANKINEEVRNMVEKY